MAGTSAGAKKGWETRRRKKAGLYGFKSKEEAIEIYANNLLTYDVLGGFKPAAPVPLNAQERAKARRMVTAYEKQHHVGRYRKQAR